MLFDLKTTTTTKKHFNLFSNLETQFLFSAQSSWEIAFLKIYFYCYQKETKKFEEGTIQFQSIITGLESIDFAINSMKRRKAMHKTLEWSENVRKQH